MWAERLARTTHYDNRQYDHSTQLTMTACDALIRGNRVIEATFRINRDDSLVADSLARLLTQSTTIQALTLHMIYGSLSASRLAAGIRENRTLKRLQIHGPLFGNDINSLLGAISQHPRLEELQLDITHLGSPIIASRTLRRITLNNFAYLGVHAIVDASPSLETLDITNCTINPIDVRLLAVSITNHPRLRRLCCDSNPIGNDGAITLAGVIHRLQSLSLRRCGITDLERFAESVRDNDVTTELFLDYNQLNELRGIDVVVSKLSALEKLSLGRTNTHREGATLLARTIRGHPTLYDVFLSDNRPTNDGIVDVVAALMSRDLSCVANFSVCTLTSIGLNRLSRVLTHTAPNATLGLNISHNHDIDCDTIARVVRSPKIRALRADRAHIGDGRLIARAVANNPNLQTLLINFSAMADVVSDDDDAVVRILNTVARHPRLERIGVGMRVHPIAHRDAIVSVIENNRRIKHIEFGTFGGSDARLLAAIWRSASLVDVVCNDQDTVDVVKESRAPDVLALLCLLSCVDVETGPLRAFARRAGDGALFISIAEALL